MSKHDKMPDAIRAILNQMTPEQLADTFVDASPLALPESARTRVIAALEARAQAAGFEDLDAYLDENPDGIALWANPIDLQLTEKEQAEMQAAAALAEPDPTDRLHKATYNVHVTLLGIINECAGGPVTVDRDVMSGKPCVRGSHVPVDLILTQLTKKHPDGRYYNIEDVVHESYDFLNPEQAEAAVKYAAQCVRPQAFVEATHILMTIVDEDEEYDDDDDEGYNDEEEN